MLIGGSSATKYEAANHCCCFNKVFVLQVVADAASPDATPLPACSDSSWGPGVAVDQLGLVASPPDGIVTTDDGRVNLEFKKTKPAYVLCKLRRNGMRDEDLEKCINEKDVGDAVQVSWGRGRGWCVCLCENLLFHVKTALPVHFHEANEYFGIAIAVEKVWKILRDVHRRNET